MREAGASLKKDCDLKPRLKKRIEPSLIAAASFRLPNID
jgi:hypothetical protein